jgi:hypothetical protein
MDYLVLNIILKILYLQLQMIADINIDMIGRRDKEHATIIMFTT